jgi:hypothetical protein
VDLKSQTSTVPLSGANNLSFCSDVDGMQYLFHASFPDKYSVSVDADATMLPDFILLGYGLTMT